VFSKSSPFEISITWLGPTVIDKRYARSLLNKINVFEEKTGTKKQIFLTLITTMGLKKNIYTEDLVHSEVVLIDLFALRTFER